MNGEARRMGADAARHPSSFSPLPHRLAVTLASATFPLLFIGGLVTSLGVGLAVPDWPTTFGYNMFLYPWSKMIGGIFYEHSHRLVASCVGLLTIALALTLWFKEDRPWLRWLGVAALVLVIFQGVLGGLRVVLLKQTLAIVHACFAQAFFAVTVSLVLFTSRQWREPPQAPLIADGGRLRRLALITTALIYLQIVFGALLRHTGEWLEGHLLFAALAALHVVLLLLRITRQRGAETALVRPAFWLGGLLLGQLILGAASYFAKLTALMTLSAGGLVLTTTTHLIIGAAMLVTSLTITLRAFRFSTAANSPRKQPVLTEQYSV